MGDHQVKIKRKMLKTAQLKHLCMADKKYKLATELTKNTLWTNNSHEEYMPNWNKNILALFVTIQMLSEQVNKPIY